METKVCTICDKEKELNEFYSHNKIRKDGTKYIYHNPECKECTKEKAKQWRKENIDRARRLQRKYTSKPDVKERQGVLKVKYRKQGKVRDWQRRNKHKIRQYQLKRQHKDHDITDQEWYHCREYFNFKCAYCGIDEIAAKEKYDNYLHKDHAEHKGSNNLSNCIPACKSCNSSKRDYNLIEWYKNEDFFNQDRLDKINKWLNGDYRKFIKKVTSALK